MSFQLHIRHNIDSAQDLFGSGRVETFDGPTVRVGRGGTCECRLNDSVVAEHHFTVEFKPVTNAAILVPVSEATLYLNEKKVCERVELRSGDEIRIDHWLLRFEKLYSAAPFAHSADFLALTAKIMIALILVSEVVLAFWLPSRARTAAVWQEEVTRQKTLMLLDDLRRRAASTPADTSLNEAAWSAVSKELESLARYLRDNQNALDELQWQALLEDLKGYAKVIDKLEKDKVFQDLPDLQLEVGLKSLLEEKTKESANEQ